MRRVGVLKITDLVKLTIDRANAHRRQQRLGPLQNGDFEALDINFEEINHLHLPDMLIQSNQVDLDTCARTRPHLIAQRLAQGVFLAVGKRVKFHPPPTASQPLVDAGHGGVATMQPAQRRKRLGSRFKGQSSFYMKSLQGITKKKSLIGPNIYKRLKAPRT